MKVIYKYVVSPAGTFTLLLPLYAKVLHVALQDGAPELWIEHETNHPAEPRTFHRVGTGWPLPNIVGMKGLSYIGTWQEDSLVWHLYEEVKL